MDTGPVLALEPLSTIMPGNYRQLQHPRALDRPTLFLGDRSQEHTVPRRLCPGAYRPSSAHRRETLNLRSKIRIQVGALGGSHLAQ